MLFHCGHFNHPSVKLNFQVTRGMSNDSPIFPQGTRGLVPQPSVVKNYSHATNTSQKKNNQQKSPRPRSSNYLISEASLFYKDLTATTFELTNLHLKKNMLWCFRIENSWTWRSRQFGLNTSIVKKHLQSFSQKNMKTWMCFKQSWKNTRGNWQPLSFF